MEPFATTAPSCMVGAAMSEGIPTMIETMVEVGIVMVATTPVMEVATEMLVEVPIVGKWSPANIEGRIKTPTERAIKDSISWDVGIAVVIRIPIPSGAIPVTRRVDGCRIPVGVRGIRGAQTAPTIEIVLGVFYVEFIALGRIPAERNLVLSLNVDVTIPMP